MAAALDPLLAPALEMAQRPVIKRRAWAEGLAERLTGGIEILGAEMMGEQDRQSRAQLEHLAEALGVMVISLCAYARGVVPRIGTRTPNVSIEVSGKRRQ